MAKPRTRKVKPAAIDSDANKAWRKPDRPKHPCEECDGSGMGPNKTYHADSLVDWDDCPRCEGTGEEPIARAEGGGK